MENGVILMKLKNLFIVFFLTLGLGGCDVDELAYIVYPNQSVYAVYDYENEDLDDEVEHLELEEPESTELTEEEATVALATSHGLVEAEVISIIDGDTIVVSFNGVEEHVRFIGMDTPERGQPGFNEASEFVRSEISNIGDIVWLQSSGNDRDPHGRIRRYIWLGVPSSLINEEDRHELLLNQKLLDAGHAVIRVIGSSPGSLTGPIADESIELPETVASTDEKIVYWTVNGSVWHRRRDCHGLRNANESNIRSGTVSESRKDRECNHSASNH